MTPNSMAAYVAAHGSAWSAIVSVAYNCKPEHVDREAEILARATAATKAVLKRKIEAIHHKREQGWTEEAITKMGQGPTLSAYAASRKARKQEPDTILRYRVAVSLGAAWCSTVARIAKAAQLETSDDLIEFLNAHFADMPLEEIRHQAGRGE